MRAFRSKKILYDHNFLDGWILVDNGQVQGFMKEEPQVEIVDYRDAIIAPGLVDTHIHGYGSKDIMDVEPGALNHISQGILSSGVTSFLATTLTQSTEDLNAACALIGKEAHSVQGAKVQGIFLEGPFFTEEYKGAQNPAYMSDLNIEKLEKWQALSEGLVRKIAISPEKTGAEDFIRQAKAMGVEVALGHSNASGDEAMAAIKAGANIFVHTFNGMSPLHHRFPGMVGACLASDAYAEVICDGHHVHPMAVKVLLKAKGRGRVLLVTDCMRAGGMPDGESKLGDFPVIVKDGTARLASDGSLAGSILMLKDAVKNVIKWGLVDLADALEMASYIPAQSVNIADRCGVLTAGRDADFIVMDEEVSLLATYLDGDKVYERTVNIDKL